MKRKVQKNSSLGKSIAVRRQNWPGSTSSQSRFKFQARFQGDAASIRKEVQHAKEKLKQRPSFFEQMGSNDLLPSSKD